MGQRKHDQDSPKNEIRVIKLCGVQGCCPELHLSEDGVRIKDDFGGSVQLTKKEFQDLKDKIKAGEVDG